MTVSIHSVLQVLIMIIIMPMLITTPNIARHTLDNSTVCNRLLCLKFIVNHVDHRWTGVLATAKFTLRRSLQA